MIMQARFASYSHTEKFVRVMGKWSGSHLPFLVCMGKTVEDALSYIVDRLTDYDAIDRRHLDALWLEHWRGTRWSGDWIFHKSLPLTTYRRKATNLLDHRQRREARESLGQYGVMVN